jgi:predicted dehydrogenase
VSALHAARKYGFQEATTDAASLVADPRIDTAVICTRHDTHAALVCEALRAGKHVFVEKPLAITRDQLAEVVKTYAAANEAEGPRILMVGFNRRFAPHVRRIHELLRGGAEPKTFVMTVNAGSIPSGHWTQDRAIGGGRIIGEMCHFIDLLRFLAGARITGHHALCMRAESQDTVTLELTFSDGSIGAIHYLANGHRSFPKERLEVFTSGRILQLDNFRSLTGFGWPGFRKLSLWRQDKGHDDCVRAFCDALRGRGAAPIPPDELFEVSRVTLDVAESLR